MNNAKFTFFYLLELVALAFAAIATGTVIFQLINKFMPDAAGFMNFNQQAVKFAVASIIVAAPVFYWTANLIRRSLIKGELKADAPTRRWLTYLIIFAAAVTALGWLIGTLNAFLNGDLTGRFIWKFVTVLVITATVFGYYFYDIKKPTVKKDKPVMMFLLGSLVLMLAAFIVSWTLIDSPQLARAKNNDNKILSDFSQIDSAINSYYLSYNKMPVNLSELYDNHLLGQDALKNAVTGADYEYLPGDKTYELCAEFQTDNTKKPIDVSTQYLSDRWPHDAGRQCVKQTVNSITKDGLPVTAPIR